MSSYPSTNQLVIDRRFQMKYTFALVGAILGAVLPVAIVSLYFLNENYNVFIDLALTQSPELLVHLTREKTWVNICVVALVIGVSIFSFLFGLRMTNKLAQPLLQMREHIKMLSRGHWNIPDIVPSEEEEFYELVEAYHYFYKSLRHQTKSEIERLQKVAQNMDPESQAIWQELISEKAKRLNISLGNK
ncbi:MAG: hypothetical protein AB7F59_00305 [Bdellovibrionales bacterium]